MTSEPPVDPLEEPARPEPPHGRGRAFPPQPGATVYDYHWADGSIAFKVVRREAHNGHKKKDFKQWSLGPNGWEPRLLIPSGKRPLFRLPSVTTNPTARVLAVEGEKTAVAAAGMVPAGWVVTAWSGGSEAVHHTDWSPLQGRDVTIWPDNDAPGFGAAADLQRILPSIRKVPVPLDFPDKWDLADKPPPGWDRDRLLGLLEGAAPAQLEPPEEPPDNSAQPVLAGIVPHLGWDDIPVPARKWIVDGIVPARTVTLLQGDGGLGKSLLTLQLAHACVTGRQWLGQITRRCNVLAIYCEDDADELHRRLHGIVSRFASDPDDQLPGQHFSDLDGLTLASRVGMENLLMLFEGGDIATFKVTELLGQIAQTADQCGAELIILDSLHDLFGGNENNRVQARQFVNGLQRIAIDRDGAVILNGHPSKAGLRDGDGSSGSTAWNNSVRSRLYLARAKADGDTTRNTGPLGLEIMKANYAAAGERIELTWKDGFFEPAQANRPSDPRSKRSLAEIVFLDCLREVARQGRYVTDSGNASNFAPRTFAQMPSAKGLTKYELQAAMQRLFAANRIVKGPVRGHDRKTYAGLVEASPGPNMGVFGDID